MGAYQLLRAGEPVPVEPQVFDVLVFLIENRDRLISKEEILDTVWGDRFVSESALTSRIKSARQAVGDDGRNQRLIRTYHGRGYQFVGDVTESAKPIAVDPEPARDDEQPAGTDLERKSLGAIKRRVERLALSVDEEFAFVGRSDSLELAQAAMGRVETGSPCALLIGGEPGIGKTRLATEIARAAAENGAIPLAGRCDRHLSSSLQPWLEALGLYVETAPADALAEDVEGIADHLRPSFPTLDARLKLGESDNPRVAVDEYAIIDSLVVLLERASKRRPLVVVIDDIQWAGGATRALTSLLLRRGVARVLAVLTFRTTVDDLSDEVSDWLAGLEVHSGVTRQDLAGLKASDVSHLAGDALGAEAGQTVGIRVWGLSEGQPLFVTEMLRDMRSGVGVNHLPDSIAMLIRTRLKRMPSSVVALVSAGAALGQEFQLANAAESAGLGMADALDAVDIALGAELIHEVSDSADGFRFSHQLVPMAVLDNMSKSRRLRLHARIVEVLEASGAPSTQIAHHLLLAAPILDAELVLNRVRATASSVLLEHQYDTAADLLNRCLVLRMSNRDKAEVLTELGQAYNAGGRQPQALDHFEQTAEMARKNGWTDILVEAALGKWGQSPFRASQDRTVVPLLDEALARESEIPDQTRARLLAKRAAFSLFTANLEVRRSQSAEALEITNSAPSNERLEVLEAHWMAIASPATVFEIEPLDEELAVLRKELGALTTDACAPEIGLYWRGNGEALRELADELRDDPRQRRDVDQWRARTLTGTYSLFEGDYDEAREITDSAVPLGIEPWGESGRVVHALFQLFANVLDGRPQDSLQIWIDTATSVPSDSMRATRAWVEALAGDAEVASELLDPITPRLQAMAENFMGGFGLAGFAGAVIALERHDLIEPLAAVLEPLADRMLGHPWAPSFAAAELLAGLDELAGDVKAANARCQQALELYQSLGATSLARRVES